MVTRIIYPKLMLIARLLLLSGDAEKNVLVNPGVLLGLTGEYRNEDEDENKAVGQVFTGKASAEWKALWTQTQIL